MVLVMTAHVFLCILSCITVAGAAAHRHTALGSFRKNHFCLVRVESRPSSLGQPVGVEISKSMTAGGATAWPWRAACRRSSS